MADEQVTQVAAAAPTAVSSPLSSPAPAPSASTATPATAAASDQKLASQVTTSQTTSETTAARPEGIPDSYWDAEKNSLKVDPAALAKDLKERDELKTFKATEDIKAQTRPKSVDEFKVELPADFKFPVGIEFKFDMADPLIAKAREMALTKGMQQSDFSDFLGLYATAKAGEQAGKNAFKASQITALGTNGPARIDAVTTAIAGLDGSADKADAKELAQGIQTARQVEAWERIITRLSTQGTASFTQSHRAAPESNGIPGYEKMSFEQRRQAQDQNAARRRA